MLGLALCGGGMKCAAHLGVFQVLEEIGVYPDMLAGSSMGAVMGALYASRIDLTAAIEQLYRVRMADLFVGGFPLPGLNHARRIRKMLTAMFGDQQIEDLAIPLVITACDLITGKTVWMQQGNLADALYASCAVPGFFPPLERDGLVLADGCLSDPLPVGVLRAQGASQVIGVSFGLHDGVHDHRRAVPLAQRTISILLDGLAGAARREVDLLIRPPVAHMPTFAWNRRQLEHCILAGRQTAHEMATALAFFVGDGIRCSTGQPLPQPSAPDDQPDKEQHEQTAP